MNYEKSQIKNMENEEWKGIEEFECFYQVSNNGRVKPINPRYKNKQFLKLNIDSNGYFRIKLFNKLFFVHRLVAKAFIPNPLNKPQVNHKDGNKQNNNVKNLEWVTAAENNLHACRTGLSAGCKQNTSKLTEEQVIFIRNHYIPFDKTFSMVALAKKFNMTQSSIYNIIYKNTYRLIDGEKNISKQGYLTQVDCENIKQLYKYRDKKNSLSMIAKKYGVSITTIFNIVKTNFLRISKEEAVLIRKTYIPHDKIWGQIALAQKYKVNTRTIWKILKNKIDYVK